MNNTKHQASGQRRMSTKLPAPWTRTTKTNPCPICHRAGCLVPSPTNPAAVICARTESPKPIGTAGYLHVLRDGPTWAPSRASLSRIAHQPEQPLAAVKKAG